MASAAPSPTSSSGRSTEDEVVVDAGGVEMAPVHDEVRDDIICAIFNLPKTTVFYQDFSCAYVSTIVYHGRMYPAGDQVCFYSNLFGKETKILIPYKTITDVSKTSNMFSHGLRIHTRTKEYSFTSFWGNNRDHCASIIHALRVKAVGDVPSPASSIASSPKSPTPVSLPPPRQDVPPTANVDEHPYLDMVEDSFEISVDRFVELFMGDEAIYGLGEANRRRGATDIQCALWVEQPDEEGVWTRTASFTQPVDAPIGPKSTRIQVSQRRYRVDDKTYHIDTTTHILDIPYGDCFKVDDRFVLTAITESSCDLLIQLRVIFNKSTLWRGIIESRAKSDCKQKSLDWIQLAKQALTPEGLPPYPLNAKGVRLARKPKAIKTKEDHKKQPTDAPPKKRVLVQLHVRPLASIVIPWIVIVLLGLYIYKIHSDLAAIHTTLREVQENISTLQSSIGRQCAPVD